MPDSMMFDTDIPERGYILYYTRQEVELIPFNTVNERNDILKDFDFLELHIFDNEKEYRITESQSHRFKDKKYISHCARFHEDEDVYRERVLLKKNFTNNDRKTITILNKLAYDESGMSYIDDYRLVIENG